MSTYKKILAAIDLTDEAGEVVSAALEIADTQGAELHVLTTIRPLSYSYSGFEPMAVSPALANFHGASESMYLLPKVATSIIQAQYLCNICFDT